VFEFVVHVARGKPLTSAAFHFESRICRSGIVLYSTAVDL